MIQHQVELDVQTRGRGFVDLTRSVAGAVGASGVATGLALVFCAHTSASLVIQENADASVRDDFEAWFERLAPDGDPAWTHVAEGPDDMSAHLRSALLRTSESIPIARGKLALGVWQALWLVEHRTSPQRRRVLVHVTGVGA